MKVSFAFIFANVVSVTILFGQYILSISIEQEKIINQAIDSIYNLKFDAAHQLISELEHEITDYPGIYLLRSYYLLWKHAPLKESNPVYKDFIATLDQTISKSKVLLEKSGKDPEAIFFSVSAHAILSRLHVDNGHNFEALNEAYKAYQALKSGFELKDRFTDLNLFCGIYNYYIEKYPEENPVYKPLVWLFRKGDKAEGLEMLKKGSERGLFTQPECLAYLYFIYLRYEFLPETALPYARQLVALYPNNTFYTSLLVENLIFLKSFNQVDSLLNFVENSSTVNYIYIGSIYRGLYEELYQNNFKAALTSYLKALTIEKQNDVYTPHYASMLYLGLGRTYLNMGHKTQAKEYLKKSAKISEYGFIRDDAKRLLDDL